MSLDTLQDKIVLVTGGTGSFGKAFIKQVVGDVKKIIVYSRDEYKQFVMQQEFDEKKNPHYGKIRYQIGDVRDKDRMIQSCHNVDYVIHAAALKQVPTLEYCPEEAVKTNVNGTMNVIDACLANKVKRAVFLSTDKAVNPINLYGATKLCAEKLWLAANSYNSTVFNCVRYGNVLASRGSVIELYLKLKEQGIKEYPVTHKDMTRFWLTLNEAVNLVLMSLWGDGKIFVPKVKSMKISEIALAIMPDDGKIVETGVRPGEKMHEALISEDTRNVAWLGGEARRYTSNDNEFFTREEFMEKLKCLTQNE